MPSRSEPRSITARLLRDWPLPVPEGDKNGRGTALVDGDETAALLRNVLDAAGPQAAMVLDAYALGALSHDRDLATGQDRPVVLTPNRTEAGYLLGREPGDDLTRAAVTIAERYSAVVSLHGHIADPDGQTWREENGHVGLGTSGRGDVLAGIVAGLLARGARPAPAH